MGDKTVADRQQAGGIFMKHSCIIEKGKAFHFHGQTMVICNTFHIGVIGVIEHVGGMNGARVQRDVQAVCRFLNSGIEGS